MKARLFFLIVFLTIGILPLSTQAATLEISPSSGTFVVGSTFTAQILLDSKNESVNAMDLQIAFPPDKLQVALPVADNSFIDVWTVIPQYSNQNGTVRLQGGVPNGIVTSRGVIVSLTFRVKQVGQANLHIKDNSRVLLNDGKGTDVLTNIVNGNYNFVLPPPAGPTIFSQTHSNQNQWYSNADAILEWTQSSPDEKYSYILNEIPVDIPDNIPEIRQTSVTYKNLQSGTHYFHIKAKGSSGIWGGVSHFALNIDNNPPAEFPINIEPGTKSTAKSLVASFETTDANSGLDHYEYQSINLKERGIADKPLFIEGHSPEILHLNRGSYNFIVRAYDKAGNIREETVRITVLSPFVFYATSPAILISLSLLIVLLSFMAWYARKWHLWIFKKRTERELPKEVQEQLRELGRYRTKYGKTLSILFIVASLMFGGHKIKAAEQDELSPPIITTISRNISNEEIFYVGGKTNDPNVEIILYLQNLQTGEATTQGIISEKNGSWFYRAPSFLNSGKYILWAQAKLNDTLSPPTPQVQLTVTTTAIQFGASRLSYETLYLILDIGLGLMVIILVWFILHHLHHGRKNQRQLKIELQETEEAIRHGFAMLRRDLQWELEAIKKTKLKKEAIVQEQQKEEELLKDMLNIEQYLGKKILDIEEYLI